MNEYRTGHFFYNESCRQYDNYNVDCVYYEEDMQMEGRIRTCAKLGEPYKCPCENCDSYLPKSKLHEFLKKQQDEIERLKEKVKKYELEKSWEENPDRMNGSGGW